MLYRPGLLGRMPCPSDWYPGSGPPTISDDFSAGLASGWTFTRASTNATNCLYSDPPTAPAFTTYAANVPRMLQYGLLIEPSRTNLFLNSEAPASQSVTLAVGYYTFWMHHATPATQSMITPGTGVSSPAAPITTNGNPTSFRVTTAGTFTVTPGGGTIRLQLEAGTTPTSYIQTTAATATRADDRLNKNYFGGQLNTQQGTYWVEFASAVPNYPDALRSENGARIMVAGTGSYSSNNGSDQIVGINLTNNGSIQYSSYDNSGVPTAGGISTSCNPQSPQGRVSRIAVSVSPTRNAIALDYNFGGGTPAAFRPSSLLAVTLGGGGGGGVGGNHTAFNGYIRGFKYWPVVMPDAELKECTGAGYYGGSPVFDLDGLQANQWRMWQNAKSSAGNTATATDALMSDPAGTAYNQYPGIISRFTPKGILMDPSRANFIPNGFAPVNSVTSGLGAGGTYLLSMRGTGSVTLTANTATGSFPITATQGNPVSVTIGTAGTANVVITGSVELAQLEQGGSTTNGYTSGPSSFIRNTTAAQTRQGDGLQIPLGPWFNNTQGTYVFEFSLFALTVSTFAWGVDDGTANNREQAFASPGVGMNAGYGFQTVFGGVGSGRIDADASQLPMSLGPIHRHACSYSSDRKRQFAMDGVLGIDNFNLTRPTGLVWMRIGVRHDAVPVAPSMFVRRWRYYDYAIFDEALRALSVVGA